MFGGIVRLNKHVKSYLGLFKNSLKLCQSVPGEKKWCIVQES